MLRLVIHAPRRRRGRVRRRAWPDRRRPSSSRRWRSTGRRAARPARRRYGRPSRRTITNPRRHARLRRLEVAGERPGAHGIGSLSSTSADRAWGGAPTSCPSAWDLFPVLNERFDIVGLDPRGIARWSPSPTRRRTAVYSSRRDPRTREGVALLSQRQRATSAAASSATRPLFHVDRERRARLQRRPRGGRRQDHQRPRVLLRDIPGPTIQSLFLGKTVRSCSTARSTPTST